MDLHYSQTRKVKRCALGCFTTLWIYTILKRSACPATALSVLLPYGFTLFSNISLDILNQDMFYYLMDLHYSQTCVSLNTFIILFYYLMDLHYSQT